MTDIFRDKTTEMPGEHEWPVRVKLGPEKPWEVFKQNAKDPLYDHASHDVQHVSRPRYGHKY